MPICCTSSLLLTCCFIMLAPFVNSSKLSQWKIVSVFFKPTVQHEYPNTSSFFGFTLYPMHSIDLVKRYLIVANFSLVNTNFCLTQKLSKNFSWHFSETSQYSKHRRYRVGQYFVFFCTSNRFTWYFFISIGLFTAYIHWWYLHQHLEYTFPQVLRSCLRI
jgi:hypothetical protein